jgi:hypothetical protein
MANGKKRRMANGEWRMANGEWWVPGRGGSQTRPGCVVAPASCPRPIARGDGRDHSRTPICPSGKCRGTACRALTVTGVSQPPFVDTHLTVRMVNGEWCGSPEGRVLSTASVFVRAGGGWQAHPGVLVQVAGRADPQPPLRRPDVDLHARRRQPFRCSCGRPGHGRRAR